MSEASSEAISSFREPPRGHARSPCGACFYNPLLFVRGFK
nr:MAG TPA_asm: hypothetical protein [Caudoviricetes sp.]